MTCTQIEKLLPLFVSDDCAARDMAQVRAHLEHCECCSAELDALLSSRAWMQQSSGDEVFDESFYADLRSSVRAALVSEISAPQVETPGWFSWLWRPLPMTMSAAILLLMAGFWLSRSISPKGAPAPDVVFSPQFPTVAPTMRHVDPKPLLAQASKRAKPNRPRSTLLTQEPLVESQPQVVAVTQPLALPPEILAASAPDEPRAPEMLRIEMQTADPNIRIIWLTPRTAAAEKE